MEPSVLHPASYLIHNIIIITKAHNRAQLFLPEENSYLVDNSLIILNEVLKVHNWVCHRHGVVHAGTEVLIHLVFRHGNLVKLQNRSTV